MMHYRPMIAVVILLILSAGCGDSGEEAAGTGSATTAETLPEPVSAEEPTPDAATGTGEESAEMSPENCPELVAAISGAAGAVAGSLSGNPTTELPVANMRALADRIPEIGDDLNVVADAYEAFFARLEELGVDLMDPNSLAGLDPAVMEQINAAGAALEEGPVAEANENIQAFFERECS